ncbi:MAG: XRE family transcriptional regulator [Candidatus Marsarchaeota archaeon]|nr:XRE family transcriptional regulator [Candidatus Marsarchaeota archaeon]
MAVSERLRYSRDRAGLTLSQVKEITGIGESSLSDFETGKREPKLSQLQKLVKAYHRSLEFILSDSEMPTEVVLWREYPKEGAKAVESQFLQYCTRYHNLELWNDDVITPFLPSVQGRAESYNYAEAEALAKNVRDALGLGDRPALELLSVLQETCGAKVFHDKFEPSGTAASTKSDEFGMAVLLNANNKRWRRNFDLAHELFHLLTWHIFRRPTDDSSSKAGAREEQFADVFARSLLMPMDALTSAMSRYKHGDDMPVAVYFDVARQFDVSVDAVIWRWHHVSGRGEQGADKSRREVAEAHRLTRMLEQRADTVPSRWPDRYKSLGVEALRNGQISVGRFAEYLEISRREAMEYVEQEAEESEEAQAAYA